MSETAKTETKTETKVETTPKKPFAAPVAKATSKAKPKAEAKLKAEAKPELSDEERRALALEKAEKDYVDPHADLKAKMAEYGTMSKADEKELAKALKDS